MCVCKHSQTLGITYRLPLAGSVHSHIFFRHTERLLHALWHPGLNLPSYLQQLVGSEADSHPLLQGLAQIV